MNVEVAHKICETRKTWLTLAAYWKATEASTKLQLLIYEKVVRSKLMYGLETAALTEALKKKCLPKARITTNSETKTPIQ